MSTPPQSEMSFDSRQSQATYDDDRVEHTLSIPWNTTNQVLTGLAGFTALFYAAPYMAHNVHDDLGALVSSGVSRLPLAAQGWLSSAGTVASSYLPSVSGVSTYCRGAVMGVVAGVGGTLAVGARDGFDITIRGRTREPETDMGEVRRSTGADAVARVISLKHLSSMAEGEGGDVKGAMP